MIQRNEINTKDEETTAIITNIDKVNNNIII